MPDYSIEVVAEDSILISWDLPGALPQPEDAHRIAALANNLLAEHADLIFNVVPAYRTLLLQFHVLKVTVDDILSLLHVVLSSAESRSQDEPETGARLHKIPVYYAPEVAADIRALCESKKLTIEKLVHQHTLQTYTVYALGFKPGFAYLGYVPLILEQPRKTSFRGEVAAGSVGIADRQTAIYPAKSPGGWNIIGRTPMSMLDNDHALLQVGDEVRFYAIDKREYLALGGMLNGELVTK